MSIGDSESQLLGGVERGESNSPNSLHHLESNGDNNGELSSRDETPSEKQKKLDSTRIVQVANIAPQTTREEMQTLFSIIGKIEELRLYPSMDLGIDYKSKICYVKFKRSSSVPMAQHLTNTVFIDRALVVIPFVEEDIPEEQVALDILSSGTLLPGIADPKLPQHVTSQLEGYPPNQFVSTFDPKLQEANLPMYPPLPSTCDGRKIEEIRRTVLVANLDKYTTATNLIDFFTPCGEIKYLRLCTRDNDPLNYALIEFTEQPSILEALKLNGSVIGTHFIKVYHSTQAISKPQAKTNEAAQKEIEDAMSRQAQSIISKGIDIIAPPLPLTTPHTGAPVIKERVRSRSRSRDRYRRRSRSRSRSRSRRRRSRSSSRRRSSRSTRKRTRSPSRDRVLRRPRSRTRSRDRKRSSRKSSRSRKSRTKSRSKSRSPRRKEKEERKKSSKDEKDKDKKDKKDDKKDDKKEKSREKKDDKKDKDRDKKDSKKDEKRRRDDKKDEKRERKERDKDEKRDRDEKRDKKSKKDEKKRDKVEEIKEIIDEEHHRSETEENENENGNAPFINENPEDEKTSESENPQFIEDEEEDENKRSDDNESENLADSKDEIESENVDYIMEWAN